MGSLACSTEEKEIVKAKLIKFLEQNKIEYKLLECCGCGRFCIDISDEMNACKKCCCSSELVIQTSNKDVYKIHPHEIMYIAIEERKSVLYLINRKLETNYPIDYWKNILAPEVFAQPHHSFIVNFNYVDEITKDFVKVQNGDTEYSVYTSQRKIVDFKRAFLKFRKQ